MTRVNRGLKKKEAGSYRVVTIEDEADVEAPANYQPGGFSYRVVERNRRGRAADRPRCRAGEGRGWGQDLGRHRRPLPRLAGRSRSRAGGASPLIRGFNSLDVNVRGSRFHLVNTHLEAADATVRAAQAEDS